MDAGHRGAAALNAKDFATAITHLTTAITASPTSPFYHIQRSTAYQKLHSYDLALADAERAVVYAHQRQKRELIAQAQLRRAIPLFFLGRYGDAERCLEWSERYYGEGKEKLVGMWRAQVGGKTKGLEVGDERLKGTMGEVPVLREIGGGQAATSAAVTNEDAAPETNGADGKVGGTSNAPAADARSKATLGPTQTAAQSQQTTPPNKIRHDWYQTATHITLTILVKNAPKDTTSISIASTSVSISIPISASSTYELTLDPLYAPIEPHGSKYRILGTKIEVTLEKSDKGLKWHSLETAESSPSVDTSNNANTLKTSRGVADPYSRKAGKATVDWDAIGRKPPPKAKDKDKEKNSKAMEQSGDSDSEEKLRVEELGDGAAAVRDDNEVDNTAAPTRDASTNGVTKSEPDPNADTHTISTEDKPSDDHNEDTYYDSEEESSGDPNYFFKKLFAGASDDVKKAMMKSYQESGGTALSTNWEDVRKERVKVEPPEGMEAREWEGVRSRKG